MSLVTSPSTSVCEPLHVIAPINLSISISKNRCVLPEHNIVRYPFSFNLFNDSTVVGVAVLISSTSSTVVPS